VLEELRAHGGCHAGTRRAALATARHFAKTFEETGPSPSLRPAIPEASDGAWGRL